MGIVMYDSVDPGAIPGNAALVAAYVDGFGGYASACVRFGTKKVVSISIGDNDADVADVENGAMSPGDLPGWIDRQHARGLKRPGVYMAESNWGECRSEVGGRAVSYWVADWRGSPFTLAGADAVQYTSNNSWDASWVLDTFPWYPGGSSPVTPPVSWPTVQSGQKGGLVRVVQFLVNWKHNGVFGTGTKVAVQDFQRAHSLVADGIVGPLTWPDLTPTIEHNSTGNTVRAVQEVLGMDVNGDFGTVTLDNVKAFQAKHKLTADGIVGPNTWNALVRAA